MLVLIGAKENHGPFGQKFNGSERTVALRPEPGAGSQARHARAAGGSGAQPSLAAFQLGLRRRSIRRGGTIPMARIPARISMAYVSGFEWPNCDGGMNPITSAATDETVRAGTAGPAPGLGSRAGDPVASGEA